MALLLRNERQQGPRPLSLRCHDLPRNLTKVFRSRFGTLIDQTCLPESLLLSGIDTRKVDQTLIQNRFFSSAMWRVVAFGVLIFQIIIHTAFNGQAVKIFPSDGCGQAINRDLEVNLELTLLAAKLSSLVFCLFLAFKIGKTLWKAGFLLFTAAASTSFLIFG